MRLLYPTKSKFVYHKKWIWKVLFLFGLCFFSVVAILPSLDLQKKWQFTFFFTLKAIMIFSNFDPVYFSTYICTLYLIMRSLKALWVRNKPWPEREACIFNHMKWNDMTFLANQAWALWDAFFFLSLLNNVKFSPFWHVSPLSN